MSNNLTYTRSDTDAEGSLAKLAPAQDKPKKLELSMIQIVAGALAAMTAAALGSTIGLGGTIVGAALASIIAGVAGSLYTASLRHTQERVMTVFSGRSQQVAAEPPPPLEQPAPARKLSWKRAAGVAVGVFVLAAVALTSFEMLTGHALSGGAGTTVQQVQSGEVPPTESEKPTAVESATPTPTPESVSPEPQATPTTSAEPTTPAPTPTPATTPTPSAVAPSTPVASVG